jgi:hypothetical protein
MRWVARVLPLALLVAGCGESSSSPADAASGASGGMSSGGSGGSTAGMSQAGGSGGAAPVEPLQVIGISASGGSTCALRANGRVLCWMDSASPVEIEGLPAAVEVSSGGSHACARTAGGKVYCWGADLYGQLGDGAALHPDCSTAPSVTCGLEPFEVSGLEDAVQLSCGWVGCCARRGVGSVACWGANMGGQLGDGTAVNRDAPVDVAGLANAVAVSAGDAGACALDADGQVWCWGGDYAGALGLGVPGPDVCSAGGCALEPQRVPGLEDVTQVSAGLHAACARESSGALSCWGWGIVGQLGNGTRDNMGVPTRVSGTAGYASVFSGYGRACAITTGGAVSCWGESPTATGTTPPVILTTPTPVPTLDRDFIQVTGGWHQVCALRSDGAVFCWGTAPERVNGL